jgi:tRNA threonylcarbamoyladenosine biosynthesis protein TsaB
MDVAMGATREDALFPAVEQLLRQSGIIAKSLAAVVCGAGPGSFTSLRIGAALAKGLAFAAGCPLFAVSSLTLAAASIAEPGRYVVHADALRGERYAQAVDVTISADSGLARVTEHGPLVRVAFDALAALAGDRLRLAVVSSPEPALEFRVVTADAASLLRCADWSANGPVSLEAWEPVYGRLAEAQVKWEEVHGLALPGG